MKRYKVIWDNQSENGMFPLSADYSSITEAFDCLRSMFQNAKNVSFDEDDLLYQLGLLFNGDLDCYPGNGFIVKTLSVR